MKIVLILLLILLAAAGTREYLRCFGGPVEKAAVISCACLLLIQGFLALFLAMAGRFSPGALAACDGGLFPAGGILAFAGYTAGKGRACGMEERGGGKGPRGAKKTGHDWFAAAVAVLAGALYFGFPSTDMLASRDPGIYLLNGVHIAREGSVSYETDEFLNEHYGELAGVVQEGYPALYSPAEFEELPGDPGDVSPQFMPLFPALLAIGYSLFGMQGLIRVNGLIAILALLVIYFLAREYLSERSARITALLLLINPAELWGARLTETELLAQLMFFLTAAVFLRAWERRSRAGFALAGFLLGAGVMNRIDAYIYGVGLWIAYAACILWNRDFLSRMRTAVVFYAAAGALAFLYGITFSRAYFIIHLENGSLSGILLLNLALMAVCAAAEAYGMLCGGDRGPRAGAGIPDLLEIVVKNDRIRGGILVFFVAGYLFLYMVRPLLQEGFEARAAVEFSWYTSVLMVFLALWGLYRYLKDHAEDYRRMLFFLAAGIFSVCLYVLKPSISADHIWAARRWVSVSIPFVLMFGACGLERLPVCLRPREDGTVAVSGPAAAEHGRGAVVPWCVAAIVGGYFLWRSSPFLFRRILPGVENQYDALAGQLDDDTVYFTNTAEIASYLRYLYGKKVYRFDTGDPETVLAYMEEHDGLVFLGDASALDRFPLLCERSAVREGTLGGPYLEETVGAFPRQLYDKRIDVSVSTVRGSASEGTEIRPSQLALLHAAETENGAIRADAEGGLIFYGPYLTLAPGSYELEFRLDDNADAANTRMVVTAGSGEILLAESSGLGNGTQKIFFELPEFTSEVEFVLYTSENNELLCSGLYLRKR